MRNKLNSEKVFSYEKANKELVKADEILRKNKYSDYTVWVNGEQIPGLVVDFTQHECPNFPGLARESYMCVVLHVRDTSKVESHISSTIPFRLSVVHNPNTYVSRTAYVCGYKYLYGDEYNIEITLEGTICH